MSKKGLDEMQLQRKNKVGNQSFLILMYLLMLDAGLYGFGFRWVSYPANIMIILNICSAVYVVRLIKGNAYVGPSYEKEKPILRVVINSVVAILFATAIILFLKNTRFNNVNQIDSMAAPILFITSITAIIIVTLTGIIRKIQNKDDKE
ncbi:MAG: hypothetical protein K0R93_841 [Anaerosolibacter sp.]|uniref:DUF6773 family protein n=1 Tax=Anaerosolibacter sp. TaxID=1872527 RepID=UPI002611C376|nr:DUF6773 family protein [Anaerosolibacter sp.]MDF2545943.1 hypothetical protein [Anaerosolibacter sp.]